MLSKDSDIYSTFFENAANYFCVLQKDSLAILHQNNSFKNHFLSFSKNSNNSFISIFSNEEIIKLKKIIASIATRKNKQIDNIILLSGTPNNSETVQWAITLADDLLYCTGTKLNLEENIYLTQQLKLRSEELEALFSAFPDLFFRIDENGVFLDYKAGENHPFVATENYIGQTIDVALPQELSKLFSSLLNETITKQTINQAQYTFPFNDKFLNYDIRLIPLKNKQALAVIREITAQVRAQNLLEATQKTAKIGGWELDVKTGKTFWSEQIYYIYGLPKAECVNVEIGISQYHELDRDKIRQAVENAISGTPFDLKLRFIRADNREIWVRAKGTPIKNSKGEVVFIRGIFQDVDVEEKKTIQLHQKQETLDLVIQHTPAAVAMFDKKMCYIARSNRWMIDYGLGNQDIIGKSHYDIFPDIGDKWKNDHQQVLNGETIVVDEEKWIRSDGTIMYLRYELRPWMDDNKEIGGIVMFTEVITQQVLTRLNLEKSVDELLRSNADLEQFAFVASHDLQEPLRMVGSFTQLLKMNYSNQLDATGLRYLDITYSSAERMKQLINNLLDYSRVGRKEQEITNVNPKELIKVKLDDLQLLIKERNVTVHLNNLPPNIKCEPHQIGLVFYNLINNAIKFNKSSNPTINIDYQKHTTHHIFSVADNGIGLDPKFTEKVFLVFQRLHPKNEYNGTGIGLALCKKIIEQHKGKIWYEPNKNNGTKFLFSILIQ